MKHTITLKTKAKETHTHIYFGYDLLEEDQFLETCQEMGKKFVVLTDEKVAKLYAEPLMSFLKKHELDCSLILMASGEEHKTRKTKEKIEDEMFAQKLGRDTCLIAMGGGVVTDVGGFVAATYCRGIPYLTIPTTLLGMVDASIGSKTGVNLKQGKNLIGAIYSPQAIFMDFSLLSTLPDQEMRNGSAEIIKHGLIADRHLFNALVEDLDKWRERDLIFLRKIIFESCQIKKKVVEADLKEAGIRRILNFGHTIGHAIEALEGYQASHGEAIAIGMIVESLISLKLGHLEEEAFDEIYRLFKILGFPLSLSEKVTISTMIDAMGHDKKALRSTARFVVLDGVGKVLSFKGEYCTTLEESLLREALGWMIAEFGE